MLRKILTIALVLALVVAFGCKKTEKQPAREITIPDIQKQAEKAGQETEAAKEAAALELEKAGKELPKDTNIQ